MNDRRYFIELRPRHKKFIPDNSYREVGCSGIIYQDVLFIVPLIVSYILLTKNGVLERGKALVDTNTTTSLVPIAAEGWTAIVDLVVDVMCSPEKIPTAVLRFGHFMDLAKIPTPRTSAVA